MSGHETAREFAQRADAEFRAFAAGLDQDAFHQMLAVLHPDDPLRTRHGHADCTYPGCDW